MRNKYNHSRLLREGHYAGLKFDEGWLFIQVVGTEYVELKPFVLRNNDDERALIQAGESGSDTDEIRDSQDRKVLEPDDSERNSIFQIMYGVAPSRMRIFSLYGRERNKSLQDFDEPGDPAAFVNGFDSPYNNPTQEAEVFYVNSMSPLRLQAYNPMDEDEEARLSFHINKLRYNVVTDRGLMKSMLQGTQPARLSMLGGGIQNRDQVGIPNWVQEAFGEHIHSTDEVLSSNSNTGGGGSPLPTDGANLEGIRGG